jgi:hypothetical protein
MSKGKVRVFKVQENEELFKDYSKYLNKIKKNSSFPTYLSAISVFLQKLEVPILNLNSDDLRDKLTIHLATNDRAYYKKFAFKPFLDFIKIPIYFELPNTPQKPRKQITKSISFDKIKKIVNWCILNKNYRAGSIAMMQYDSTSRIGAILGLTIGNLGKDNDGFHYFTLLEKGGYIRTIYTTNITSQIVDYLLQKDFDVFLKEVVTAKVDNTLLNKKLIQSYGGVEVEKRKDLYHELWEEQNKITQSILGQRLTSHWYRHSRIIHLAQMIDERGRRKYDLLDIQRLTGHRSLDALKRYLEEAGIDSKEFIIKEKPEW